MGFSFAGRFWRIWALILAMAVPCGSMEGSVGLLLAFYYFYDPGKMLTSQPRNVCPILAASIAQGSPSSVQQYW